ncbi:MAG TPA: 3-deoxy-8-phosphooctulonate synthase, partial [Proteobacteria bacterium]|nr:3-deoxy-8-phosphooctulonate synthase [Pseudomonadota bacterium]
IFKSSYEKDNRGSPTAYVGPRLEKGLEMLARVKSEVGVPVLSDVHRETDVEAAAQVLDVIQVPAYLCQQTSLLFAVGKAGKPVNVKKGQFMAPEGMRGAVDKLKHVGCEQILLTERGSCFGYNRLVSDIRSIPIMKGLGCPVVYDATHIVRLYGIPSSDPRGGEPQFVPHLVRAAVAAGVNALFLEVHPCPSEALCDAASMIPLDQLETVLRQAKGIADLVREWKVA